MSKVKNLSYDGVGFNADWVASFRTEKQFLARPELDHLFPDKQPENRTQAFKDVYAKSRELCGIAIPNPKTIAIEEPPKGAE